ncbi:iron ABC transporter permease [Prevotella ihumii]|uniref:iron ABC transporter permease n=1 Tax=Prevotella ihumii TaxID=1917878 RepID=UPI0009809AD3|nr:iron ABC transporter permease [Prevotella ihumii]
MKKDSCIFLLLALCIVVLFVFNLYIGSVRIPFNDVFNIVLGKFEGKESWKFIVLENRLPQAITAMFCGGALAVSGLMLQTAFRNPLAGPDVFGINAGAGLGVALVMLLLGGNISTVLFSVSGFLAILISAFIGAMAVTALVFFFSLIIRNSILLLIIGIMVGYVSSSVVSLLNFFATEEGVKSYMIWGLGNFGGVSMEHIPVFVCIVSIGIFCSLLLMKPLNALLLGPQYAESLGINTRRVRNYLLVVTGLLAAITTAFCGPIAFIGLAVPHIARLILTTENHRLLLPSTILSGAIIALLCNIICYLPGEDGIMPLNAVTPLIGAPVVIYVLLKSNRG